MENLSEIKCAPCEGGVEPMSADECAKYHEHVPEWNLIDNQKVNREFEFKDFVGALKFVNAMGVIAEDEGHHPDIFIHSWNKVVVTLWTHAIGGLSINDFIVATKVDRLPR